MKVLVTGANGFIGRALCEYLTSKQYNVVPAVRQTSSLPNHYLLSIDDDASLNKALDGCKNIVHLAGLAHIMDKRNANLHKAFHAANVEYTTKLAHKAASAGVRRFIFISTVKVNGEYTKPGESFSCKDKPKPEESDEYAISKWRAEQALLKLSRETGLEVVIIRPPLVYGPGVKGNFMSLLNWLEHGVPLPLGSINNQRSLVGLSNLIDLIVTCLDHPVAANQLFLVSDSEDLSTTALLQHLAKALNKPSRLLPFPPSILKLGLNLLGKNNIAQRLLDNLQIDDCKTKDLLTWAPPYSVEEEIQRTVDWYLKL